MCAWAAKPDADTYDHLILRARAGETEPALAYLRQLGERASRAERLDHIEIAAWAGEPEEVIAIYETLRPDDAALPAPVQQAVARAYRDVQRWPEALAAWRGGLQQHPEEQPVFAAGLVMTLADAGQAEAAIQTGVHWREQAADHAELQQALAYAWRALDNTPAAQAQLEALLAANPDHLHALTDLAGLYRTRAQPRRAESHFKRAHTLAPDAWAVNAGLGTVLMDMQAWRDAEAIIARAPDNAQTRGLLRRWQVHNMAELRVSGARGLSSDSPVAGNGGLSLV